MKTDRALLLFSLMFHDPEPFRRQIDDLSAFRDPPRTGFKVLVAAGTGSNLMDQDLIGSFDLAQGMPFVPWLASGFFAALLAQRFGYPHKAIRGGRQTTVMAVFGLLPLKRLETLLLKSNDPFQILDLLLERLNGMDGLPQPFSQGLVRRSECMILLSEVV
ncbi:hypothetical protein KTT_54500 [Tengunoibacter tsumagoiensis]|uniref:Uncharacterized protein n=1 Tax=Tengunoibacter tsumagoiensis TaxID=2014871 RepID=A0A402A9G1_9CHLR|nr:hypothetical protein KTT_54500 [Tengunoibacter tsumagoiensis]